MGSSSGGWIVLDKTEPSQTVSQKDIINYDNLLQGKKIVIQDSLAFLKCCESLAFLIRDVAHITPHNFSQCVSTLRIFVEASYSGRMVNKPENLNENKPTAAITSSKSAMKRTPFNKSGPSSAIRKVRSAPHNVRSATVNSVSTPTSSDYDGDESDWGPDNPGRCRAHPEPNTPGNDALMAPNGGKHCLC